MEKNAKEKFERFCIRNSANYVLSLDMLRESATIDTASKKTLPTPFSEVVSLYENS